MNDYTKRELQDAEQDIKSGRSRRASDRYRRVLELEPENAEAHQGLARVLLRLKDYEGARKSSEEALRLDPKLVTPHLVLTAMLIMRRQHAKAEREVQAAIESDPNSWMAYVNLGVIYQAQSRLADSESALQRAIQLNPRSSLAFRNLSIVQYRLGRREQSTRAAWRAFTLAPSPSTGVLVLSMFSLNYPGYVWFVWFLSLLLPFVVHGPPLYVPLAFDDALLVLLVVYSLKSGNKLGALINSVAVISLSLLFLFNGIF